MSLRDGKPANPYSGFDEEFCVDCFFLKPPYYVRENCPCCDIRAYFDLFEQFENLKIRKYINQLIKNLENEI